MSFIIIILIILNIIVIFENRGFGCFLVEFKCFLNKIKFFFK